MSDDLATLAHHAIDLAATLDLPIRTIAEYLLDEFTPVQITTAVHASPDLALPIRTILDYFADGYTLDNIATALVVAEECRVPLDTALYNLVHNPRQSADAVVKHPRLLDNYPDF